MYDHHAHVMWQQNERRLTAAAERRRSNLEALERSRAEAEPDRAPKRLSTLLRRSRRQLSW